MYGAGAFPLFGKASCMVQDGFPARESFMHDAGAFSKFGKASCTVQGVFPIRETALHDAGFWIIVFYIISYVVGYEYIVPVRKNI